MSSFLESCFQEHYPFYSKLTTDEQQTLVLSSVLTTYQRGDFLYSGFHRGKRDGVRREGNEQKGRGSR